MQFISLNHSIFFYLAVETVSFVTPKLDKELPPKPPDEVPPMKEPPNSPDKPPVKEPPPGVPFDKAYQGAV